MSSLNSLLRSETLDKLEKTEWDLVVIGGGITGCGIALDAVSRGLKTALVEMQDYAGGTSSRSTKLIHGGLRYLKNLEFGLVNNVGKERKILYRNASHLVFPEKLLLPIVEGGSLGMNSASFGLWLYDRIAGVEPEERRVMLHRDKAIHAEPLLRKEGLKGAGLYWEYRTDDTRLTLAVLKTAVQEGLTALNYLKVNDFELTGGKVSGVKVKDQFSEKEISIHAKYIVNAAGPWVDEVRKSLSESRKKNLFLTKGVHIVVSHDRLPLKESVYFDVHEGKRMLFAIPRENITYIGTTDTVFKGDTVDPDITAADRDYLLKATNYMFPTVELKAEDVISAWAGIRPLIFEEGKSPSEMSRKDELFESPSGLISIAGGKLTGYRKMAEQVIDLVMKKEGKNISCKTDRLSLSGGALKGKEGVKHFVEILLKEGGEKGPDEAQIVKWVRRYGGDTVRLIELFQEYRKSGMSVEESALRSEVFFCIGNEGVMTIRDYLERRTGAVLFNPVIVNDVKVTVADMLAEVFDWSLWEKEEAIKEFDKAFKKKTKFNEIN